MIYNAHLEGDPFFWKAGPTGILLIHGFTATTAEVRPLAAQLYQSGLTVAGPLLPGHGTKPHDLNQIHWRDWVCVAQDKYQQLIHTCDHVFVGGESTGALVALYLAAEHPDITGILSYAPAILLNYTPLQRLFLHLAAPFISFVRKSNWTPNPLWQGYGVNPLKGAVQLFRFQKHVRSQLPGICQPILIVQGCQDDTVLLDTPDLIAKAVSSSIKEIHWMKKSGHVVILDQEFEQVTQITLKFIDRATITSIA